MSELINRWIRPEIRAINAYHVPPASGLVKLDAMENPYELPDELKQAWLKELGNTPLNRYPEPSGERVIKALRSAMNIPQDQKVLLGNGSDEIIQIMIAAVAGENRVVMAPEPSFVMYRMLASILGLEFAGIPLDELDFSLNLETALAQIEKHQPAIIFLAYPNNPTGNHWDRKVIEQVIEAAPGLVVLDEAYEPFADDSFMHDLGKYPNLVVMRTVSKLGLAGVRLGYLCGPESWLNEFDKVRLPYNINVLTQVTVEFAMQHQAEFDRQAEKIKADRVVMQQTLAEIDELTVFPSAANFLLFRVPEGRALELQQAIREKGVLIKSMQGAHPALHDCLRVTVGAAEENAAFIDALKQSL